MLLNQRALPSSTWHGTAVPQTLSVGRPVCIRCPTRMGQRLEGTVITKMDKTVNVEVTRFAPHPIYVKRVRKVKKFLAHDENNECKLGDIVSLLPDRPRSKLKRWQVGSIVRRSQL